MTRRPDIPEGRSPLRDGAVLAFVLLVIGLVILFATGCADVRLPAWYSDGHVELAAEQIAEVRSRVAAESEEAGRLELADFHVRHARGWTKALLRHKGTPPGLPGIPRGPDDAAAIAREQSDQREYLADVEAERALKAAASGWVLKLAGGGGGLGGLAGLFMLYRKRLIKKVLCHVAGKREPPPDEPTAPKTGAKGKRGSA